MLGRRNRFHGHNSLRYVYTHGKVVRGPIISLKYCHNPKRAESRLAVVVSKKVVKSAVGRNRIRRRVYEQIRLLKHEIHDPYDLVVTVFNEELATLPTNELKTMLRAQLKQAGVTGAIKKP